MLLTELLTKIDALLGASRIKEADLFCQKVVKDYGANFSAMSNLGQCYAHHKMFSEAKSCFYSAVGIAPENYKSRYMLGHLHMAMEEYSEAVIQFTRALSIEPNNMEALVHLGVSLNSDGREEDAVETYRQALSIVPDDISCNYNLGLILKERSQFSEAIIAFKNVLKKNSNLPEAYNSLGYVQRLLGQLDIAKESLEKAIELKPLYAEAYYNLGCVYQDKLCSSDALRNFSKAIDIKPDLADAYWQKGNAYIAQGDFERAESSYRKCLEIIPDHESAYSNLLLILHYNPHTSAEFIFNEHREWAIQLENNPIAATLFQNRKDPEKRLNIGYLSPDLRAHSVAYFIDALLAHHDEDNFRVFVYSDVARSDDTTRRFQGYIKDWRDIYQETNENVMSLMRNDELDILIDLAGHTSGGRAALISQKPAPLIVTYLGYPDTTGLKATDYRITDDVADPSSCDQFYTETLIRLPNGFLCYTPAQDCPPVSPAPCVDRGYFTFCSFNNVAKVNHDVVRVWSDILHEVADSRLLLKSRAFFDQSVSERYLEMFHAHGIADDRVETRAWALTSLQHLSMYSEVDLALDTFPYNGTTTTCESLWMGVPVITLAGDRHAGRVGSSILMNVGLEGLVARTHDEYVTLAGKIAQDYRYSSDLRSKLRDKVVKSSLGDAVKFTILFEESLRGVWRKWCH
jgi:predicted O-linked N-acetylglucosamine transferase (SPINDLY family)